MWLLLPCITAAQVMSGVVPREYLPIDYCAKGTRCTVQVQGAYLPAADCPIVFDVGKSDSIARAED